MAVQTAWLPTALPFILGFADFNNLYLMYSDEEARRDPLKAALNRHATEDGSHVVLTTRYCSRLRPRRLWRPLERRLAHRLHYYILDGMRATLPA